MRHSKRWIAILGLLIALPQLSACTQTAAEGTSGEEPAKVEHVEGSEDVSRLTLHRLCDGPGDQVVVKQ